MCALSMAIQSHCQNIPDRMCEEFGLKKKIYLPRVNFSSTILNASHKNLNSGLTTLLLINVYFPTPKYSDVYVYNVVAS